MSKINLEELLSRAPQPYYSSTIKTAPAVDALRSKFWNYPQISAQEQAFLAKTYQEGLRSRKLLETGKSNDRNIRMAIRNGDRAIEMLIGVNFKLIYTICRELTIERYGISQAYGMLPDMIADAQSVLVEIAEKFNSEMGPTFSAYAAQAIRNRMRINLSNSSTIRVPPAWSRIKRIASARIPELRDQLGREPTQSEIVANLTEYAMDWAFNHLSEEQRLLDPENQRSLILAKLRKSGMLGAIKKLDQILNVTQNVSSLNKEIIGSEGRTLEDYVPIEETKSFDNLELTDLREALYKALEIFSDRDREIVLYRFGFIDGEVWKYAQLSLRYGISAERIRQIERSVLTRLMEHDEFSNVLFSFIGDRGADN
jgi:RNA polymerase nonessential primary-like sigma factor